MSKWRKNGQMCLNTASHMSNQVAVCYQGALLAHCLRHSQVALPGAAISKETIVLWSSVAQQAHGRLVRTGGRRAAVERQGLL